MEVSTFRKTVSLKLPQALVAVKIYLPVSGVVTFAITGFCKADKKPFGPVHPQLFTLIPDALRVMLLPEQIVSSGNAVAAKFLIRVSTST